MTGPSSPYRAVYLPPTSGVPLMPPEYDRFFVKHLTDRLDALVELHKPDHHQMCTECGYGWPCATYRIVADGPGASENEGAERG